MMKISNNIMIIDTETFSATHLVHDVGYVIIDKDFNILHTNRMLTYEFHKLAPQLLKNDRFYTDYEKNYNKARLTEKVMRWCDISKEIASDIKKYNVKVISAYNLAFDYKALQNTDTFFKSNAVTRAITAKTRKLLCIYNLACGKLLNTNKYHKFAKLHNLISNKGNYKTSAEAAYRYITNYTEYNEKHTALSDAQDEKIILEYIIKHNKGSVKYGLFYNCYKKAQN